MNKTQMAELLNGREYGSEIDSREERQAKECGLLIVFGASDDITELRGIISDEFGSSVLIAKGKDGEYIHPEEEEETDVLWKYGIPVVEISGDYGGSGWKYTCDVPHETFNIYEEGELYCVGLVIDSEDLDKALTK